MFLLTLVYSRLLHKLKIVTPSKTQCSTKVFLGKDIEDNMFRLLHKLTIVQTGGRLLLIGRSGT